MHSLFFFCKKKNNGESQTQVTSPGPRRVASISGKKIKLALKFCNKKNKYLLDIIFWNNSWKHLHPRKVRINPVHTTTLEH